MPLCVGATYIPGETDEPPRGVYDEFLAPDGSLQQEMELLAQCPTMPCFGGEDLRTLYVTTARKGRSAHELALLPDSGSVFYRQVPTAGLPVNFMLLAD